MTAAAVCKGFSCLTIRPPGFTAHRGYQKQVSIAPPPRGKRVFVLPMAVTTTSYPNKLPTEPSKTMTPTGMTLGGSPGLIPTRTPTTDVLLGRSPSYPSLSNKPTKEATMKVTDDFTAATELILSRCGRPGPLPHNHG